MSGPSYAMNSFGVPGSVDAIFNVENTFLLQPATPIILSGQTLSGAARDSTNGTTTYLRQGLLLGKIASSGKLKQYDPTATDGSEILVGILYRDVSAVDALGTDQDTLVEVVIANALVKASAIVGLDIAARRVLKRMNITCDDEPNGAATEFRGFPVISATATLTSFRKGCRISTRGSSGAVTYTLPALSTVGPGDVFEFLNESAQTMAVVSAEGDNIVVQNDLTADSITFSTSNEIIGAVLRLEVNDAATKWVVTKHIGTMTVAT